MELGGVFIKMEGRKVAQLIDFCVPLNLQKQGSTKWRSSYAFCGRQDVIYIGESEFA